MTDQAPQGPILAAAAVMRRDDGKVLLLQHGATGLFSGRWSLPITIVADEETAEDAVERVLHDHTHVEPGPVEFEDTLYITGDDGTRFIVNAFLCRDWRGEPQYSSQHYADAAWSQPSAPAVSGDLLPEIRIWLQAAMGEPLHPRTPDGIIELLDETRGALLAAFQSIPAPVREESLQDGWSPVDLLAHTADVEAYYLVETDRLMRIPGHTWRGFNDAQWYDLYRLRSVRSPPISSLTTAITTSVAPSSSASASSVSPTTSTNTPSSSSPWATLPGEHALLTALRSTT
jgi:ADP-ribose pyrophosphatase YjhB (NUDIX family)